MIPCVSCGTIPAFRNRAWTVPDCECGTLWVTSDRIVFGESDGSQIYPDRGVGMIWVRDGSTAVLRTHDLHDLHDVFSEILIYGILES